MAEIKSFPVWNLPNDTHLTASMRFRDFARQCEAVSAQFGPILAAYSEAIDVEDHYMHQQRGSLLTADIEAADAERDRMYYIVSHTVDLYLHYDDGQQKTDAVVIDRYLKSNSVDPRAQYDRETGMILNLVQDLERNCAEEVARLGLTNFVTRLKEQNQRVYDLMNERFGQTSDRVKNAVSEARQVTDKYYHSLVYATNAFAKVDEAPFLSFIRNMNEYIDYLNLQVFRITGSSADKNEVGDLTPEDGENTGDTNDGDNNNTNTGNDNTGGDDNNNNGGGGTTTPPGSVPTNPQPGDGDDPDL